MHTTTPPPVRPIALGLLLLVLGASATETAPPPEGMVRIPGGTFQMGSESGFPDEAPVHEVTVAPFYLDTHEVTNADFAKFVEATGYKTEAEQWGWSIAFLPRDDKPQRVFGAEWWAKSDGANWRNPTGPGSSIEGKEDRPVVQVSWTDAMAYCEWAGKRLPTEAEWEFAARGGAEGKTYPWGDELHPDGKQLHNLWNGVFPVEDRGEDGFKELAPVGSYPPNAYGLYDIAGNVWEWCADYYAPDYYARSPRENPTGPDRGTERILRGGSWLCSESYCTGYRVSHRNHTTPDSGLNNMGFRCARSIETDPPETKATTATSDDSGGSKTH